MPVTLRSLREDEGPLLKELMFRMTTETPTAFRTSLEELAQRTDETWQTEAHQLASSPIMTAFVAEDDRAICGYVGGSVLTDKRLAAIEGRDVEANGQSLADTTILHSMWVSPELRSQGVGQLLIQEVLRWAQLLNQRRVILAVTTTNERAKRAYVRAQFTPTAISVAHPAYPGVMVSFMEYLL